MDVISITLHRESPKELLRRRFNAVLGNRREGVATCPALDAPRRIIRAGERVISPKDGRSATWLLVSGVAGEVRMLPDGRRQVLLLRLPGDILQGEAPEVVTALSAVEVVDAQPVLIAVADPGPDNQALRQAWLGAVHLEQALLRDHLVRLGCLSAYERMGHFLMETHDRLTQIGLAGPASMHLPIKQDVIADLMGLSVVHVSRTMQALKREGLACWRSGYVTLPDKARLANVSGYVSRFPSAPAAPDPRQALPAQMVAATGRDARLRAH